jgi:ribosomal protein S18 acetylase RimI-like enzyme
MDNILVREMTVGDYDRMIALWKRTSGIGVSDADTKENVLRFLERNPGLSFVCESGRAIVGTVLCGHDGRRGYIYHLAVDDAKRKQGVGKKLMANALEKLRQQGVAKCHLFLYRDNENAMKFYEHTGWTRRGNLLIYSRDL